MTGQVHDSEKNIPQFPRESGTGGPRPCKLAQLLAKFGGNAFPGIRPVETRAGGAALEVLGVEKGREPLGNAIQAALAGGLFLLFQLMPAAENLGGVAEFFPAKDMRMPAHQLVGQRAGHGLKIKRLPFPGQLGVEKNVEENVPQLLLERMVVSLIDRLEQLIDLF